MTNGPAAPRPPRPGPPPPPPSWSSVGPASWTPAPPPSRPTTPPPLELRPTLLAVDDQEPMREGIRRTLTRRGYDVTTADCGSAALAILAERDIPIVLVDLRMPEMDGFELIERIRQLRPETICIVVSAFATIEAAVQTTKMGAFDFVVKPFAPDDLAHVVNRAAEKWALEREAERLRAQRDAHLLELATEKGRLRTILHSMGQGLLVVNIDGDVVLDNAEARRLLGRVGAPPLTRTSLRALFDDDAFLAEVRGLLDGTTPERALERDVRRTDAAGVERCLRATLAPMQRDEGPTPGVVVLLEDVTDARAFEQARRLFVSMVAHEVKAPIAAVEAYLHLVIDGALAGQPERTQQVLTRCLERTGALVAMVNDLLEITRRDAASRELRFEHVDLGALTTELAAFHGEVARGRGITLEVTVASELPKPLADRLDLERVLTNLLSNAIKYNRSGGHVEVRAERRGAAVCVEVRDTGLGMSPEELVRLGEEFYRAKNERTRGITGTGLGIALVKRIVEGYRGALEVESEAGVGSTFRVLLPIEGSTPPPAELA